MNRKRLQQQIALALALVSGWLAACTTQSTPNQANYAACQALVEQDRTAARRAKFYSYSPEKFNACRAPYRFTLE